MTTRCFRLTRPRDLPDKLVAAWGPEVDLEQITCPLYDDHMRGGSRLGELVVDLKSSNPPDFLWTWYYELLCSPAVLRFLEEHDVSGFRVRRARVRLGPRKNTVTYFEIVVTGWAGYAHPSSGVRQVEHCPGCGLTEFRLDDYRKVFDESAWDGSDLFMIWPLPLFKFASPRLAKLLKGSGFSGLEIVPVENMEQGLGYAGPGRLRDSMPDDRAREIGIPLGIY